MDNVTSLQRPVNMAAIRSKSTKLEMKRIFQIIPLIGGISISLAIRRKIHAAKFFDERSGKATPVFGVNIA